MYLIWILEITLGSLSGKFLLFLSLRQMVISAYQYQTSSGLTCRVNHTIVMGYSINNLDKKKTLKCK